MKSSTLLHSAVFHLTPTRTRCDLIIMAHGKQEKIASGLLNPFVAHLKTAQEQIAKGGYSIVLEPQSNRDTSWFTKGTLERFVRFVSTPEILERVYSIESEIIQIEEAIAVQGRNDSDYTAVNDSKGKPVGSPHGSKLAPDEANEETAIILYKPGVQKAESEQKVPPEGNSRVQLLKVQETRKNVLQKEQGMAFARAVAAGFDFDHMAQLLSFAECFGAQRLMDACKSFMDLWKKKHENGQWLEIDTPEPLLNQSEYLAMSASGIMLSSVANTHQSINDVGSDNNEGERAQKDGQLEQFQGQFPHPMYAPWPMHSPGSVPVYPPYPVQGMPYYPTYPGNGPYYHPPYPANGDSRYDGGHKTGKRRQSADDKGSDFESETSEVAVSRSSSQEALEFTNDSRKKSGRSGKKKSGVVVIRNINYITSEAKGNASTESGSGSGSESETSCDENHTKSYKTSKKKDRHAGSVNETFSLNKEHTLNGKDGDAGHWQAFQGFLLRGADEETHNNENGMFAQEQDTKMKRRQSLVNDDPLMMGGQHGDDTMNRSNDEIHEINGKMSRRNIGSNDEFLLSGGSNDVGSDFTRSVNIQYTEVNGKRVITRTANDDFVVGGRSQSDRGNLADPLAGYGFDNGTPDLGGEGKKKMGDESFIVPFRSLSSEEARQYGRTIDMDVPSPHEKTDDISNGIRRETSYEPDALSLMPERGMEGVPSEYDPALDYDMQVAIDDNRRKDETNAKELSKESEKERKPKGLSGTLDKKRTGGPMKKMKPSRMNVLEDARARAEKLRSFKADMQKIKKEKEEEDKKRIEALKLERQKRIAARANPASAQKPESKMQTRKLPSKLSPISYKGSKFSDTEPGASSPLQRSKIRTVTQVSSDSRKPSKTGKVSYNNHTEGNRLTRSVSSLSDSRKESIGVAADAKASMARIRRLSEPKSTPKPVTASKVRSAEVVMKRKLPNGPDTKKISAILKLDKTKAATLPELKIKASKEPSNVNPMESTKVPHKSIGAKSSSRSLDAGPGINNEKRSHDDDVDDNPIIEKAVVMMEYEKPSVTTTAKSTVRAPPSLVDIADSTPAPSHVSVESKINQVTFDLSSAAKSTKENPYLAPYARNSSLGEPCTGNSEFGKAPPVSSYMGSTVKETDKAYVADVKTVRVDAIPEAMDKTQVRESAKGFRRLLKFGKKSTSATGDRSVDLENSSLKSFDLDDTKTIAASSSEVHTLKNLISQDESPSASSSQKSSRHFSLFAPFRGKSSEKKLTA